MTFGETIRQLRLLANMNQLHLALEWGKSVSTVSRIENDQAAVRMQDLPGLARALHTTIDYLLQCIDQSHVTSTDLLKQQKEENRLLTQQLAQKIEENKRLISQIEQLQQHTAEFA